MPKTPDDWASWFVRAVILASLGLLITMATRSYEAMTAAISDNVKLTHSIDVRLQLIEQRLRFRSQEPGMKDTPQRENHTHQ